MAIGSIEDAEAPGNAGVPPKLIPEPDPEENDVLGAKDKLFGETPPVVSFAVGVVGAAEDPPESKRPAIELYPLLT